MSELGQGDFREDTRAELLRIVERLAETSQIDAAVLGGTELPLILDEQSRAPIPLLDTTAIHVDEIVVVPLSGRQASRRAQHIGGGEEGVGR